jgi:hypothetical protein
LAADYGVVHSTLSRYFARKDVAAQLRAARRALGAEGRAAKARRVAERQLERTVRRQAEEEAALARSFSEGGVQPRRARRSDFEAWLDDRDARRPLLPQDLRSRSDELAAGAAENGGGIDALIEATGLRTLENLVRNIDPAILVRAYDNDAAAPAFAPPDGSRLRRLSPDLELLHRRAAGEPLRRLAPDYGVTHTTLGRWFARPSVAREINKLQRRGRPRVQPQTGRRPHDSPVQEHKRLGPNRPLGRRASRAAHGLSRSPRTPGHDGKGDQEQHDSDGTGDVRHHGNGTGNIAGVGPDEADNRSHGEYADHRSEPVQNPSSGDDSEPTLLDRDKDGIACEKLRSLAIRADGQSVGSYVRSRLQWWRPCCRRAVPWLVIS